METTGQWGIIYSNDKGLTNVALSCLLPGMRGLGRYSDYPRNSITQDWNPALTATGKRARAARIMTSARNLRKSGQSLREFEEVSAIVFRGVLSRLDKAYKRFFPVRWLPSIQEFQALANNRDKRPVLADTEA